MSTKAIIARSNVRHTLNLTCWMEDVKPLHSDVEQHLTYVVSETDSLQSGRQFRLIKKSVGFVTQTWVICKTEKWNVLLAPVLKSY